MKSEDFLLHGLGFEPVTVRGKYYFVSMIVSYASRGDLTALADCQGIVVKEISIAV